MNKIRYLGLLAALALAGCTGADPGTLDRSAPERAGDSLFNLVTTNPRLVVGVVIALIATTFIAWVWKSPVTKILLALVVGGVFVWLVMR
jgi:hypothetical protein